MPDYGFLERLPAWATAVSAGLTGWVVAWLMTPIMRIVAARSGWVGRPAQDRWGRRVVARLGGVAISLGAAVAFAAWVPWSMGRLSFAIGLALIFVVGLIDDVRRMPPYTKLVAQLLVGCLVVLGGIRMEFVQWPWLSIPLSVLWLVFVMNAFNLLDNMDGLAAGIGAIGAGFFAVHAAQTGQGEVAAIALGLCGACLGFLWYNFPPAKIYMGDSGSHFIGLGLGSLVLLQSWNRSTQLVSMLAIPLLLLAVPIFDTCFVVIQRLLHRRHPFTGGTDHVSHRMVILGLSVRQTLLALYMVSASFGLLGVIAPSLKPLPTVAIWLSVLTGFLLLGRYLAQVKVYRSPATPDEEQAQGMGPATAINTMLLHKRRLLEILVDFCLISSVYVFAHLLRFEGVLTPDIQALVLQSLPIVLVLKLSCFLGCRLYQGIWRYVSVSDLLTILKAVTLSSILSSLTLLFMWRFEGYSRAVFIIDWALSFLAIGGSRVIELCFNEWIRRLTARGTQIVVIGAGDTGAQVVRSLVSGGQPLYRVMGLLDDDPHKRGGRICGIPVAGPRSYLSKLLEECSVQEVFVAIADPPAELLEYIRDCCEPRNISWRIVTAGLTTVR